MPTASSVSRSARRRGDTARACRRIRHFGRGDARIIETADGKKVLRFVNFSVRNGLDLHVYLSVDAGGKKVEETLNLGRLKATGGAFNYEIPANIDVDSIKSVVVWCRQFSTLFAVEPLI